MSDVISLRGVRAFGHHGVLPEERQNGQSFEVDVVMHVDLRDAGATDDLSRTVDYSAVATQVVAVVEGEPCQLIETVAGRIADVVLGNQLVGSVEVTVHKPEAPVGVPFADVSVTVVRSR